MNLFVLDNNNLSSLKLNFPKIRIPYYSQAIKIIKCLGNFIIIVWKNVGSCLDTIQLKELGMSSMHIAQDLNLSIFYQHTFFLLPGTDKDSCRILFIIILWLNSRPG